MEIDIVKSNSGWTANWWKSLGKSLVLTFIIMWIITFLYKKATGSELSPATDAVLGLVIYLILFEYFNTISREEAKI